MYHFGALRVVELWFYWPNVPNNVHVTIWKWLFDNHFKLLFTSQSYSLAFDLVSKVDYTTWTWKSALLVKCLDIIDTVHIWLLIWSGCVMYFKPLFVLNCPMYGFISLIVCGSWVWLIWGQCLTIDQTGLALLCFCHCLTEFSPNTPVIEREKLCCTDCTAIPFNRSKMQKEKRK